MKPLLSSPRPRADLTRATAANFALSGFVDWRFAALFLLGGAGGGWIGMRLAVRFAKEHGLFVRIFAAVLFCVAAYMLYHSGGQLLAAAG